MDVEVLIDREHGRALVGERLYAVWPCRDGAHVHALPSGAWLGRITTRGVAPSLWGVRLAGSARRRKGMRALGAIQRAWWADDTQRAAARGEDGEG